MMCGFFFFYKQKTAYELRISDWSSDVCSSDLADARRLGLLGAKKLAPRGRVEEEIAHRDRRSDGRSMRPGRRRDVAFGLDDAALGLRRGARNEIGRASCRERVCQFV